MTLQEEEQHLRTQVEMSERTLIFWFKKTHRLVSVIDSLEVFEEEDSDPDKLDQVKNDLSFALSKLNYELDQSELVEDRFKKFISKTKNK